MRSLPTSLATDLSLAGLPVIPELEQLHKQLPAAQDSRRHSLASPRKGADAEAIISVLQQATTKPRERTEVDCIYALTLILNKLINCQRFTRYFPSATRRSLACG